MYALMFNFIFQGLAVVAAVCVAATVVRLVPFVPQSLSSQIAKALSPVLRVVEAITPSIVPRAMHLAIAAFWLLLLRVGLYLGAGAYGLLPPVTS